MSDRVIGFLILIFVLSLLAAVCADMADAAESQTKEHCEWTQTPMDYAHCISAGFAWVIVGTSEPDNLVGYLNDDIIRSGLGKDYVNGRGGYDVCYVQPGDTVRNCEEES